MGFLVPDFVQFLPPSLENRHFYVHPSASNWYRTKMQMPKGTGTKVVQNRVVVLYNLIFFLWFCKKK